MRRPIHALPFGMAACALALAVAPIGATAESEPSPPATPVGAPDAQAWLDGVAWDDRGSAVLDPAAAIAALDALAADQPAVESWSAGGSRTGWFGKAWEDVDGDGCDTRNEILARDLSHADFSRADGQQGREDGGGQGAAVCPDATVWSGVLHDPYTGASVSFQRGQSTSDAVQIDHVVPLNYLYAHGAWAWDARTRLLVANDPLNLVAVEGKANQSKGACGPATCPIGSTETGTWSTAVSPGWWPPNDSFRCAYAQRFVSVAAAYRLGLPDADRQALRSTLADCSDGGDGAPSIIETTRDAITRAPGALLSDGRYRALLIAGMLLLGAGIVARARRALRRASRRRRRG
ncbi:HNH endonuclease family protein [Actinomyces gaoshouyii]|uniref:HNH endonuclease family protein n=1 Tax=Actinomyces gaoshouyii TaxID=1960083 RepID=UPI0009BDC419|nr:HNH endonuclease family protein [Actinomyces gaoshouyii]ARD41709.1 deoxyribonuclease [Actinomyces gaoshouyii]